MSGETGQRVLISKADYARHRDCSPPYVSKLCRDGKIVLVGNLIDRDASDVALANLADPSKSAVVKSNAERYGKQSPLIHPDEQHVMANLLQITKAEPPSPLPAPADEAKGSYAEAKTEREQALADTARFDLDVKQGKYVERELATGLAFKAGRSWRDKISIVQTTLPTAITALVKKHIPNLPADVMLLLQHEVGEAVTSAHREALENVSQQITILGESLTAQKQ